MYTPSPSTREPYKILRLIGALIVAAGCLLLLNALIGPEASAGMNPDAQSLRMELPASMQPARQIEK